MNPEAERSSRYTLLSSPWEGSGQKYSGTGAGSHNEVSSTPGTGVLNSPAKADAWKASPIPALDIAKELP